MLINSPNDHHLALLGSSGGLIERTQNIEHNALYLTRTKQILEIVMGYFSYKIY